MARDMLTDEQVELEIRRLQQSPAVKLAQKEQQIRLRRRKQMYDLRWFEKRGKQLAALGVTMENIEETLFGDDPVV